MPNYQNGKIYMIWCEDDRYYGSTADTLSRRFSYHKASYRSGKKTTSFVLFEKYGIENCRIELVELFPCNSRMELEAREGFYIRGNRCINKNIPYRTEEEISEYKKIYREEHKEEIKIRDKAYDEEHKEERREKTKAYWKEHREELNEKKKAYYEKNKDKIKEKAKAYREKKKDLKKLLCSVV